MDLELRAAARWWADQLRLPMEHNTGAAINDALINSVAAQESRPDEKKIALFETYLFMTLMEKAKDVDPRFPQLTIYNDYHADAVLRDAAETVGIKVLMTTFPMKSCMWIKHGNVRVRRGYAANEEVVYQAPEKP